jgi:Putative adhesin
MRKAGREDFGAQGAASSRKWAATAAFLAMAVAVPLWAQQSRVYRDSTSWVEEITGTLPTSRQIRITTDLGSVQVQGTSPRVTYIIRKRSYAPSQEAARRQFEQMHISTIKNAEGDFIEGRLAARNLNRFSAEFLVQIPRELEMVKVETRSGLLNFSSIVATILGATGGGSVTLDDLDGSVKITSGGGNVEVGRLGSDFSLTTGGGDVHIKNVGGQTRINIGGGKVYIGSTKGADIQTGAGNIEVHKCAGDLGASSGGGNLNLGDVSGAVQAETTGGSVHLDSAKGRVKVTTGGGSIELFNLNQGAQVETGAGGITAEFVGKRGSFSDSSLHTAAGDVIVYLPKNLPVTVHASSDMATGHGIASEFSGLRITKEGNNFAPRSMYAEGSLNGGGPALKVRTIMGQIDFRQSHWQAH